MNPKTILVVRQHWKKICLPVQSNVLDLISGFKKRFKLSGSLHVYLSTTNYPRRSQRYIVLASSVRPCVRQSIPSVCPSIRPPVHTFCLSGTISQYLLVRFESFLIKMTGTMDSGYPISLVKIDPLTLELLPLFWYRQL